MNTIAVTFYSVVLWLHISAVVLAFGPTFAFGLYITLAQSKYPRAIPPLGESQIATARSFVALGGILTFSAGMSLIALDPWDFTGFFPIWGLLANIVLLGLAHGFFRPNAQ